MSARGVRSLLFRLHKWLGLQLIILFAILFATGTLLVVSDEMEALIHPQIWAGAPPEGGAASFGEIYDKVQAAYPAGTIWVVQRQPQPWLADRTYLTTGWGEKVVVWTDPATAAVRTVTADRDLRAVLRDLHDSLLVPGRAPGRLAFIAVAATGWFLLYSVVSGLIAYRRFWKGFFRWPTRALGVRGYQGGLHRLLGLWGSVFLLIIAVTSIYFMANGLGFMGREAGFAPAAARETARPAGLDGALVDAAEARARAALDGFRPTTLVLPGRVGDGLRFSGYAGGDGAMRGDSTVSVDPVTRAVLGVVGPAQRSGLAAIRAPMDALHFGDWSGALSRALWVVFGLAGLWLLLSGARVHVARSAHLPGADPALGPWRRFARGLGPLRWADMGLVAAVVALLVLDLGPWSARPAWIAPAADPGLDAALRDGVSMRIDKPMRAGKSMHLTVFLAGDLARAAVVEEGGGSGGNPGGGGELARAEDLGDGGRFAFSAPVRAGDNRFVLRLTRADGGEADVVFDLGAPIR